MTPIDSSPQLFFFMKKCFYLSTIRKVPKILFTILAVLCFYYKSPASVYYYNSTSDYLITVYYTEYHDYGDSYYYETSSSVDLYPGEYVSLTDSYAYGYGSVHYWEDGENWNYIGGGGWGGGGGSNLPPDDPTDLKIESDVGSIFVSWQNPASNYESAIVVWTTDGDFDTALTDPNRHADANGGYYCIEGLSDGTPYNVLVLTHGPGGFSSGSTFGAATPGVPLGFLFDPDSSVADASVDETTPDLERLIINYQKSVRDVSVDRGTTLRSILSSLNAALATAITPLVYTAQVHEAARHVGIRIAREAYLKGEITAAQYVQIAEYIMNGLDLPPVGMAQGEAEYNINLARNESIARVAQARNANENKERVPANIYRFGGGRNGADPRPARARPSDFGLSPDALGSASVGPEALPFPNGASCFGDVNTTFLNGTYWKLPVGTILPPQLGIAADGSEVPGSPHGPTHYTIYPKEPMTLDNFNAFMRTLPWTYGGTK